jgi:hypothetical protein
VVLAQLTVQIRRYCICVTSFCVTCPQMPVTGSSELPFRVEQSRLYALAPPPGCCGQWEQGTPSPVWWEARKGSPRSPLRSNIDQWPVSPVLHLSVPGIWLCSLWIRQTGLGSQRFDNEGMWTHPGYAVPEFQVTARSVDRATSTAIHGSLVQSTDKPCSVLLRVETVPLKHFASPLKHM